MSRGGTIQQGGQIGKLLLIVVLLNDWNHLTLQQFGTDDEDGHVHPLLDDGSIGYQFHWRGI